MPNVLYYYWAANFQKLPFWLHAPDTSGCHLKAHSCIFASLPTLLCSFLPASPTRYTVNPVVLSTLKIWYQFRQHFKFSAASTMGPINKNHVFVASLIDNAFSYWTRKGSKCFQDTLCLHLSFLGIVSPPHFLASLLNPRANPDMA